MSRKKINKKLNEDVNQETQLINSLTLIKYLLIYIPLLFLMFATAQFLGGFFFDIPFDWKAIVIQAICFALFFRIFHKVRFLVQKQWKNKHN